MQAELCPQKSTTARVCAGREASGDLSTCDMGMGEKAWPARVSMQRAIGEARWMPDAARLGGMGHIAKSSNLSMTHFQLAASDRTFWFFFLGWHDHHVAEKIILLGCCVSLSFVAYRGFYSSVTAADWMIG